MPSNLLCVVSPTLLCIPVLSVYMTYFYLPPCAPLRVPSFCCIPPYHHASGTFWFPAIPSAFYLPTTHVLAISHAFPLYNLTPCSLLTLLDLPHASFLPVPCALFPALCPHPSSATHCHALPCFYLLFEPYALVYLYNIYLLPAYHCICPRRRRREEGWRKGEAGGWGTGGGGGEGLCPDLLPCALCLPLCPSPSFPFPSPMYFLRPLYMALCH